MGVYTAVVTDGAVVYDNELGSDELAVGTIIGGGQIRIQR